MFEPVNQGAVMAAGQALVPNLLEQSLRQSLLGVQQQQAQTGAAQESRLQRSAFREEERQAGFSSAMEHVLANPSLEGISHVLRQYPEFHAPIKQTWEAMDKRQRQGDLTQLAELFSAGANDKWDIVEKQLQARVAADKAAGDLDDMDDEMLAMVRSQDPKERRKALGIMSYQIAAVDGLDKFAPVLEKLRPVTEGESFEQYARALGYEPGTDEYDDALQDYVLRGQGPTAYENRARFEGVEQGNRVRLEGVRQRNRVALERAREDNRRSRPAPGKPPSPTSVIGKIMAKEAAGQALTPGEARLLAQYNSKGRGGGRGRAGGGGGGAIIVNPQTGKRLQLQGGKWVPVK